MEKAMLDNDIYEKKVHELCLLTAEIQVKKSRVEELKAFFEAEATECLKNTKKKTMEFWGVGKEKIVVGTSETVSPVSMRMLKGVLGDVFSDFVKEDVRYSMTTPCKKLLASVFLGNYTEGTLDETVKQITPDEKVQQVLMKKLKGNFKRDLKTLLSQTELSETDASDWAYLISEVKNWENLLQVLTAANWKGTMQQAMEIINAAVIVEEGIKVTVEMGS